MQDNSPLSKLYEKAIKNNVQALMLRDFEQEKLDTINIQMPAEVGDVWDRISNYSSLPLQRIKQN